jgi:outer membrane immunogenic protein
MLTRSRLASAARLSAALVSLGAIATGAQAAPQVDHPFMGWYVGLNAGGAFSNSDADAILSTNPSAPIPANPIAGGDVGSINAANVKSHYDSKHHNTFTGGLQGGYNWVTGSGFLFGVETDIDYFHIRASKSRTVVSPLLINPPITYTVDQSLHTDFLWTLRPRVGYVMGDFLIFGSAGIALTETHFDASFIDSAAPGSSLTHSKSKTEIGWTIGGGAAYAITQNISVKGEYLYQHFGTSHDSVVSPNGYVTLATDTRLRSHLFRAGVNYNF